MIRTVFHNPTASGSVLSSLLLATLLVFALPGNGFGRESSRVFTLWPLIDYRHSQAVDYSSLHLFGPLFKYERKGEEREYGFRPFYYTARDQDGNSYSEYLYPVASRKAGPGETAFQTLRLLDYEFGKGEENEEEFMLFPFIFYGDTEERGRYFAFFPFGGKIYDKFQRDEIRFTLFPLYGRTRKEDTTITNVLWPFFARVRGENEWGWKFWPLYGAGEKEGVYRKRFYLWPIVFRYDQRLDTEDPTYTRTVFPLFVGRESPLYSSRIYLWPFFSHIEDRAKNYEEWNFPWPLFSVARGSHKEGHKFLPFYADVRQGDSRKRWYLWPLFKVEETRTEIFEKRRFRVLWFLYSNLEEKVYADGLPPKRRVALWPLFTYERVKGVSRFHTFSLLEPFFPENDGIERNWSPLWRIYQRKWDRQGNEITSLLWNLYWKERRGDDLALEVFPLFRYSRRSDQGIEMSLLKGLFRYRHQNGVGEINLFYLPWGIGWEGER